MPDLLLDDASDLARFAYGGYFSSGSPGPISIVEARVNRGDGPEDVTLVGLAGTDVARVRDSDQAVGVREDVLVGLGSSNNAYFREAKAAILANVEPGGAVVLTGHSLGGMVAQQLAADPELKDQYDITNTVTFGSPLIRPGQREGEVQRLGDAGDPVPQLSVEGMLLPAWRDFGLNREVSEYSTQGIVAAHNESYLDDRVWGRYDALGDRGGSATLTYDPSEVRFYEAPRVPQTLQERSDATTPEPEALEALARSVPDVMGRMAAAPPAERAAMEEQTRVALDALNGTPPPTPGGDGAGRAETRAVELAGVPDVGPRV